VSTVTGSGFGAQPCVECRRDPPTVLAEAVPLDVVTRALLTRAGLVGVVG
jgi:hypothetical protein